MGKKKEDITKETIWNNCLSFIRDNLQSQQSFETWFKPIKAIDMYDNVLVIQVPSKFFYEWLEEHYIKLLKSAITRELGPGASLRYNIAEESDIYDNPNILEIYNLNRYQTKTDTKNSLKDPFNPIEGRERIVINSQLNDNYTFDNFVEGECNSTARMAGITVSKRPGNNPFNPLFIYGGVGMGKTHLVNAIGLEVKKNNPEKNVLYISAEQFTRQYIDSAIRNNDVNNFIYFYQMIDVLIVDDIQFFSGKTKTVEVFFGIFNHLHQMKKQIILASDRRPSDIKDVESRLLSRFQWGALINITKPGINTRINILNNKAHRDGLSISDKVIEYIAHRITTNIRDIEGVLTSLIAQSLIHKQEISIALAKEITSAFINNNSEKITIVHILNTVSNHLGISIDDIKSKSRRREIVQGRQISMYLCKKYTQQSLHTIGEKVGNRNHTTVVHSFKTVNNLKDTDSHFRNTLEKIEEILTS
ncbi:chromosomal replication initiator protein DnaA [Ichthyobacterium seriolicida]|uniref:Chromosomal replication initiator protein DnaA n=1 Tax=Ichthyobacterium seriolicida TaxID=242600 RepID=A0A1J1E3W9_9FLAO|nr:chromosomal replication initiator protein DnaA [Ichthyobacterium seriolicida]BAV94014.1 chromosomal replication initiator protein DnaA [Ichthyobacterium seriolicida]